MYATYLIPQENAPRFLAHMGKIARKATKLGLAPITFDKIRDLPLPRSVRHTVYDREGYARQTRKTIDLLHVAYTIRGEAPTLDGWTFVATLAHEGGTTMVRAIDAQPVPETYRTASPRHCDHCGIARNRNDTYIVRNGEGTHKQVGRTCLRDFLGNKSPAQIAALATMLLELDDMLLGFCEGSEGRAKVTGFDLANFLTVTHASIQESGWVSRSKATQDYTQSTADAVLAACHDPDPKSKHAIATCATDQQMAKEAIDWVCTQDPTNDYLHNLKVICALDYVTQRTAGYAASIVSSYMRAAEKTLTKTVLTTTGNAHVGTVGKRESIRLTLLGVRAIDGYYGTTHLHRFADSAGNLLVWFASNPACVPITDAHPETREHVINDLKVPMIEGASYYTQARIKTHGSYDGQTQTVLTRLSVQALPKTNKRKYI